MHVTDDPAGPRCRSSGDARRLRPAAPASRLERLVFNHRLRRRRRLRAAHRCCSASRRAIEADAQRQLREDDPAEPPVHQNYLEHRNDLRGLGNSLRIVVENTQRRHLRPGLPRDAKRKINDELFLTPGVDRAWVKSLWTPAVRWTEVTEEGFRGGPVMPDNYDGSPRATEQLRAQHRARRHRRQPGRQRLQVEHDRRAAARQGPGAPARRIDYRALSHALEQDRRRSAEGDEQARGVQDPRHRLRQAGRRPDRRPDAGDDCTSAVAALIAARDHLAVHALRAQHRAGGRLLAGRGGLAARPRRRARLRARPVLDPRAVPRVRDRRVARRAEDERHHAGHRPRHAPPGRRALHLPPPVPRRPDGAARRRGGLRGADGDRHPGDPGPGARPRASASPC